MRIQVSISGFQGAPATLLCVLDARSGVLSVAKQVAFTEERIKVKPEEDRFALVTNMDLPDLDFRFKDDHFREAIRAFFRRQGQQMIGIEQKLLRFDPTNRIERDSVDEKGPRYRISADIDNGQIAVLAAVAFAEKQQPIQAALSVMDELEEFYKVTTI